MRTLSVISLRRVGPNTPERTFLRRSPSKSLAVHMRYEEGKTIPAKFSPRAKDAESAGNAIRAIILFVIAFSGGGLSGTALFRKGSVHADRNWLRFPPGRAPNACPRTCQNQ